jgi:hypothetical protein
VTKDGLRQLTGCCEHGNEHGSLAVVGFSRRTLLCGNGCRFCVGALQFCFLAARGFNRPPKLRLSCEHPGLHRLRTASAGLIFRRRWAHALLPVLQTFPRCKNFATSFKLGFKGRNNTPWMHIFRSEQKRIAISVEEMWGKERMFTPRLAVRSVTTIWCTPHPRPMAGF